MLLHHISKNITLCVLRCVKCASSGTNVSLETPVDKFGMAKTCANLDSPMIEHHCRCVDGSLREIDSVQLFVYSSPPNLALNVIRIFYIQRTDGVVLPASIEGTA